MKSKGIIRKLWTCIKANKLKVEEFFIKNSFNYGTEKKSNTKPNVYVWDSPDQVRPTLLRSERLYFSKTWHLLISNLKTFYIMNRRKALKALMAMGAMSLSPQILLSKNKSTPQLHFVGLGKSGCQIVEHFLNQDPKGKFTCISYEKPKNLDPRTNFIQIPPTGKLIHPFGDPYHIVSDPDVKIKLNDEVLQLMEGNDQFVLLAGLGGFTASMLAKELTLKLHASNKDFQTVCSLPFTFEGKKRREKALKALKAIKHIPQVKYFELDSLKQKYGDLVLSNAFARGDMEFWKVYRRMLSS
jgi:hypothetical protein